jgi:hypothetical protein
MSQGLIGGLALMAFLAQALTAPAPLSQSRPYTIETFRAGSGAVTTAPKRVIVTHGINAPVFPRQTRVERGPCNMPVIVANADIDPKMIVPIERKNADVKIRAVEPSACGGLQQNARVKR